MKTDLYPLSDSVNLLVLKGVNLLSLDDVDSWLYAIGMNASERSEACCQLMSDGHFDVCNIEYRVHVKCLT
jgi:hypothetical protein